MKLRDIVEVPDSFEQLAKMLAGLDFDISEISESIRLLKEDKETLDWHMGSMGGLEDMIVATQRRFDAARRGLGIANRLPAGPDRTKHLRRIMVNMNQIRNAIYRMQRLLAQEQQYQQPEEKLAA